MFLYSWYSSVNFCKELSNRKFLFKKYSSNEEILKSSEKYADNNSKKRLIPIYFPEKKNFRNNR